jgi:hypothetical protein
MSATTFFTTLRQTYPTADALLAWLRSDEGGRIVVRDNHTTAEDPFVILHYDKETSDMTKEHVGLFRSVIWNTHTNRPVGMGPVHGLQLTHLRSANGGESDAAADTFIVEDFVDGVMINLFHTGARWQVATRTQLGAQSQFYGTRTFADLFWETFARKGLVMDQLDKAVCYSWVLQHPEERIVVAPTYGIPQLWLVEQYRCNETKGTLVLEPVTLSAKPAVHADVRTVDAICERVAALSICHKHQCQGLVARRVSDGARFKIRGEAYNAVRILRGNQAKRPYLWLERWGEGRLGTYLQIYPEEAHEANAVIGTFKQCTQEVHDYYMRVYRRHEMPLGEAPAKYRKILWEANQAGKGAYFKDLCAFMNGQDTARKLWLVNFERRYGSGGAA